MANKYPYGFFYKSVSTMTDANGNFSGSVFKIPAFLDTVVLEGFSGKLDAGQFIIEKNGRFDYPIEPSVEIPLLIEPEDSFQLKIIDGVNTNILTSYQIGMRYSGQQDLFESSSSTT